MQPHRFGCVLRETGFQKAAGAVVKRNIVLYLVTLVTALSATAGLAVADLLMPNR
jgi:hypothetical protein